MTGVHYTQNDVCIPESVKGLVNEEMSDDSIFLAGVYFYVRLET